MRSLVKQSFILKLAILSLFILVFYSCTKTDIAQEQSSTEVSSLSNALRSPAQSEESADVVNDWYKFIATLQRPVSPQPAVFIQVRAYAYIGVGLFESVQPGINGGSSFSPKLYMMPAMTKPDNSKKYLWSASANAALSSLFKQFLAGTLSAADRASIDAKELAVYNQLRLTTPEDVMRRSEAFGRSIASAIFNWSTSDNFAITTGGYVPLTAPWAWAPTLPNNPTAVGDALQFTRPFLKSSVTATAPPIPIAYAENSSSAFYLAAKEVHDIGGTITGSAANKATANWWADVGGVGVGLPAPYHVLSIITSVLEGQDAGLWKAAEVYAKTGIALKDGPIITFRAKYQYNLLRPITYIRRHISSDWLSHLTNPPYPDYSSGLVGFNAPVAQVLINEFGDIPVTDNAYGWRGVAARQYNSLSEMRHEAAMSRVYAGIHYRFTQEVSIDMGVKLGNEIDKVRVVGPEYE